MRIIYNKDNFILYIFNNKEIEIDEILIEKYVKEAFLRIKKRYRKRISGFYDVFVYNNEKIGMIIEFKKADDFDFVRNITDLNIIIYNDAEIFIKFSDLFLIKSFNNIYYFDNNYYVDSRCIKEKDFYSLIEFSEFVYGKDLEQIKNKLNLIVKN